MFHNPHGASAQGTALSSSFLVNSKPSRERIVCGVLFYGIVNNSGCVACGVGQWDNWWRDLERCCSDPNDVTLTLPGATEENHENLRLNDDLVENWNTCRPNTRQEPYCYTSPFGKTAPHSQHQYDTLPDVLTCLLVCLSLWNATRCLRMSTVGHLISFAGFSAVR
jgi:hypothetical protein